MLKHETIEAAVVDAVDEVDGDDARACGGEADRAEVKVTRRDSCVVLEIACAAIGANAAVPVLLSAAASRALAAELMAAADAVEPSANQD